MNTTYEFLSDPLFMLFLGLASHFLKDLIRLAAEGNMLTLRQYWLKNPYQTVLSIIGAIVGYVALGSSGQLTALTAFGAGYMANSVADLIGKRTTAKLKSND